MIINFLRTIRDFLLMKCSCRAHLKHFLFLVLDFLLLFVFLTSYFKRTILLPNNAIKNKVAAFRFFNHIVLISFIKQIMKKFELTVLPV